MSDPGLEAFRTDALSSIEEKVRALLVSHPIGADPTFRTGVECALATVRKELSGPPDMMA